MYPKREKRNKKYSILPIFDPTSPNTLQYRTFIYWVRQKQVAP